MSDTEPNNNNQQVDAIQHEIVTANEMLVKLDDNIKTLQEQYARLVIVIDAFETAAKLMTEQSQAATE